MEQGIVDAASSPILVIPMEPSWASFLDFVARMTEALAWPLILLIVGMLFRRQLLAALGNLKSIKWGDAEATFDREIKVATEQAKAIEPAAAAIAEVNKDRLVELIEMAAASPTGAIIEAWKDVEQAARDIAERSGLPLASNPSRPYFNLQEFLSRNALLPEAEISTFRELRMLRNRAAHSNDAEITVDQARQYIRLSDRLVDAMNTLTQQRQHS